MVVGYSSRCKACNSPNRCQIEAWHDEGKSSRVISTKLKEQGEKISDRALDNHFDEHYNVQDEAAEQYRQSQENLERAGKKRLSDIEMLDTLADEKFELHQKLGKILNNRVAGLEESEDVRELPNIPTAYITLYNGCASEIRQALKTKQELLGDDGDTKKAKAMESWVDLMTEDE